MRRLALLMLATAVAGTAVVVSCMSVKRRAVVAMTPDYEAQGQSRGLAAELTGRDKDRPDIAVRITPVSGAFQLPTDIQFVPGASWAIVLEKAGTARWTSLAEGTSGLWLRVSASDASEQGLLGLAFHPRFLENGRFFLNYTTLSNKRDVTRIEEWVAPNPKDVRAGSPRAVRTVLEVEQPYPNHNAGQLAFGPDGFLYVGMGDGGFRADPHGHGQNPGTMLGAMLRIDVNASSEGRPYGIPKDNPFVGRPGHLPEVYALGLRNPWRYSFDPRGRLVVADVGQDQWEEVNLVSAGDNLGWKIREGRHCFSPKSGCQQAGLVDPIFEYGRAEGQSITGGYVYTGKHIPNLVGKYVFGDFVTGRLWALDLPERLDPAAPMVDAIALGKWPILPSTFGRDADGELYVADFDSGRIFRVDP